MQNKSEEYPEVNVEKILASQKTFFRNGGTRDPEQRIAQLKALKKEIEIRQDDIAEALYQDFKKPEFETFLTETSFILSELKYLIKNLKKWSKPEKVKSSILNFPSSDISTPNPMVSVLF